MQCNAGLHLKDLSVRDMAKLVKSQPKYVFVMFGSDLPNKFAFLLSTILNFNKDRCSRLRSAIFKLI